MGLAFIIGIIVIASWAFWVAYVVNKEGGYPLSSNGEPTVKTVRCNQNCNQGRDCDCFQRSCDMTVKEYYAHWPFPTANK
jgi:hypothetical protein